VRRALPSPRIAWTAVLLSILLLAARCPVPGQTFFNSGDGAASPFRGDLVSPVAMLAVASDGVAEPTVVEGDLFRVLAPDRLLNLNAFRGLQVIDLQDATKPKIIGRLQVSGSPVELYVVGDIAFVLVNGLHGYTGMLAPSVAEIASGGMVLSVDLSDPTNPVLLDQAVVPGAIETSRLTRQGDRAALYVVTQQWSPWNGTSSESRTVVASFDVASGRLEAAGELDLGGSVSAVNATPALLLVARNDYASVVGNGSRVALVDISDPSGAMQPGDEVGVEGAIESQFNMDHHEGVLRIVSAGSGWGSDWSNHLQTFDASDLSQLVPIDAASFGANEDLFATIFLGNRAFFVTYRRVDPFHAFEISDDGVITPGAEFIVSGWNDFFRPVLDDSRLIGIGVDDEGGQTLAVSLYDVTETTNSEPLLARQRVAADGGWSEASFDHRAFSVLDDAVSVSGPGGVLETGIVLLPFSGWDSARNEYTAAVQIFTFSGRTLTRRGSMAHGSPVRRSFEAAEERVANLSETELSLFATADPDQPAELGRVDLAPDYTDVFRFGAFWVRIVNGSGTDLGLRSFGAEQPPAVVEVVPGDADPDLADPVARFEIPSYAAVYRSGPFLVTIESEVAPWTPDAAPEAEITVYDLRKPAQPRLAGKLRTDRLQPAYSYWPPSLGMPAFDCFRCFAPQSIASSHVAAVPGGLAFLQGHPDRRWTLDVLELGEPEAPLFAAPVALAPGSEGVGLLVDGSDAWVTMKHPQRADRRGRVHAGYFVVRVDVSDAASPFAGEAINVPGELVGVEGATIFTHDRQWNGDVLETAVVRLALEPGVARVEAVRWFSDRNVEKVVLDRVGHVLVSHGPGWQPFIAFIGLGAQQTESALTVLDADSDELDVLSELPIESSASLLDTIPGRVLFRISAGLLVLDLDDASAPRARAFFPTYGGLPEVLINGRSALSASGRYGILRFDLDASNLP
jgi:hypothetical protein